MVCTRDCCQQFKSRMCRDNGQSPGHPLVEGSVVEEIICSCRRRGKVRREDRSHEKAGSRDLEQHKQHRHEVPSVVLVEVKQAGESIIVDRPSLDQEENFHISCLCPLCFRKSTQSGSDNGAQHASQNLEVYITSQRPSSEWACSCQLLGP